MSPAGGPARRNGVKAGVNFGLGIYSGFRGRMAYLIYSHTCRMISFFKFFTTGKLFKIAF
jgi:hypothetical protein